MGRISLSATGFYSTPKVHWDPKTFKGRPFYYFAYGAACSEVALDLLTGENRILRTDILHDVGRSLNPAIDIGQIEGGYVQGCLLYTSDAADDLTRVDLGGRRIIKKKKTPHPPPPPPDAPPPSLFFFFFSSRRRHTRFLYVSWARRCV